MLPEVRQLLETAKRYAARKTLYDALREANRTLVKKGVAVTASTWNSAMAALNTDIHTLRDKEEKIELLDSVLEG